MSLKKPCGRQGCHNLCGISDRYCVDHIHLIQESEAERQKAYDTKVRKVRDKEYTGFYHSPEWQRMRDYIIKRYDGIDLYAFDIDHKIVSATMVHHIVEIKESFMSRLNISNLIPLSDTSHAKINTMYQSDKKKTQQLLYDILRKHSKQG